MVSFCPETPIKKPKENNIEKRILKYALFGTKLSNYGPFSKQVNYEKSTDR
jgi:hypothetical protein